MHEALNSKPSMVKKTKKKEKESDLFSLHMKVSKRGTLEK
jgi:hypothetical protein